MDSRGAELTRAVILGCWCLLCLDQAEMQDSGHCSVGVSHGAGRHMEERCYVSVWGNSCDGWRGNIPFPSREPKGLRAVPAPYRNQELGSHLDYTNMSGQKKASLKLDYLPYSWNKSTHFLMGLLVRRQISLFKAKCHLYASGHFPSLPWSTNVVSPPGHAQPQYNLWSLPEKTFSAGVIPRPFVRIWVPELVQISKQTLEFFPKSDGLNSFS